MVECGVRTVGVDYLSVGAYGPEGDETHRILLGAGIWVIEGLDLEDVEPGLYELLCLPLRIGNGDGAPARALLRALP
jgi:arylformamidase